MTVLRAAFAAILLVGVVAQHALAQSWPARPVRIVVPYPPGGSTDLLVRSIQPKLADALGQPVIVDNRAGGNGTIGSDLVARAAPDGHTLLIGTGATHGLTLFLSKSVPYDPIKDFSPITAAAEVPIVLAVSSAVTARNAKEFVDFCKANPGKLSYGSSGTGSPHHLAGELLKQVAGADIVHVPYKGAAPAVQDLIGNQVSSVFTTLSTAIPHARGGKIRLLGLVEAKRQPSLPDVPTIGESVPGYVMPVSWLAFFGPAGLPEPVLKRLNTELVKAVQAPEVRAKLETAGMPVLGSGAEEFAKMLREDIETYRRIVTAAGIKPE
mgnify:CR=1 FL=1